MAEEQANPPLEETQEETIATETALQLPTAQTEAQEETEQASLVADPNNSVAAEENGSANMMPLDPTALGMNGFPITTDPTYMATLIDPMQVPMMAVPAPQPISADEIALYDRQIRLWGVKAQEKIRSANILLIGMKALGSEIAKNLVLAGVGTLTILDHEIVTDDDLGAQFFISEQHIGQNRAQAVQPELQKLNPRVNLFIDPDIIFTKLPEYFSSFDITIATGLNLDALTSINMSCRSFNRKFYAADNHGTYGFIFSDLIMHQFVVESVQSNKRPKPGDVETATRNVISVSEKVENGQKIDVVTKSELFDPLILVNSSPLPEDAVKSLARRKKISPLLTCLRALFEFQRENNGRLPAHNLHDLQHFTRLANEKHLELQLPMETLKAEFFRSFIQNLGAELSPVSAFLGGHLAQDVINVLGQRQQPLQNFLLFDGDSFTSSEYSIHPVFDASMTMGLSAAVNGNGNGVQVGMDAMPGDMGMNGVATASA